MKKSKVIRYIVVPLCVSICAGALYTEISVLEISVLWKAGVIFSPIILYILYLLLSESSIKKCLVAYKNLLIKAKMRGLWHHKQLDDEIVSKFKKSQNIELKLSRGYHLFKEENNNFYKCLNDLNVKNKQIEMKILLSVPCIKSKHIQQRASINVTKPDANIDEIKDYIWKGLDTVIELHDKNVEPNNLIIKNKYYKKQYIKWRYYIFDNDILYLAYYDDQSRGIQLEMYKIYKGNKSLCEPFHRHFEDIWTDDTSIEAIEYIKSYYSMEDNDLTKCSDCEYKEICAELRERFIKQINAIDDRHMGN